MGANVEQVLVKYMVVIEVDSGRGPQKYFKDCHQRNGVLNIIGGLKDNEKVLNIFSVNEFGGTVEHDIKFINGKLQVVEKSDLQGREI